MEPFVGFARAGWENNKLDPVQEMAVASGLDPAEPDVALLARHACRCTPGAGAEDDEGIYWCDHCNRPMLAATVGELAHGFAGRPDAEAVLVYESGLRRLAMALKGVACKNGACEVPADAR